MGLSQEEIKAADASQSAPEAAAPVAAAPVADSGLQERVVALETQVANLKEEVRQTTAFIQRKYPYG